MKKNRENEKAIIKEKEAISRDLAQSQEKERTLEKTNAQLKKDLIE